MRAPAPFRQPRRARHRGAGRKEHPGISRTRLARQRTGRHLSPQISSRGPARARGLEGEVGRQSLRRDRGERSEEHTSELQSLMRISYAVFCLKKKKTNTTDNTNI